MSLNFAQNWLYQSYSFFSKKVVYHSLIWISYIIALLVLDSGEQGLLMILKNTAIHIFFLIAIIYFNYIYLITRFLFQKKYFIYLSLIVLTALVAMPLEMICLYWNSSNDLDTQLELLSHQTGHFIFLLVALFLSTIVKIIKEWILQQRIQKDLEYKNLQSELTFLKSQINPHFLFNTLNSIYALTLKKSDNAPEIVLRLSEMMRYMLYKSNEKEVPLKQEIQYIENYLALERVRYGDKVQIAFEYAGDDPSRYQIAPLLFIPFLENSFKHGLSQSITHGFVECLLYIEDHSLDFTIQNSKTTERDERYFKGGIGLSNVKRRLKLIYPNRYKLDIEETEEIYLVNLKIDLY